MLQGHPRPWPVAKPRTLRVPARKVQLRIGVVLVRGGYPAGSVGAGSGNLPPPALPLWTKKLSTSAALPWATSLSSLPCWVVPPSKASSPAGRASSLLLSPLQGTASPCLYLAAIPPHLCRGEPRQKCSGRPGCSRPRCCRLLAQRVSAPLSSGPHPAPVGARAGVDALYFYSWGSASSRGRECPAWALVRAHSFGPFRPRPRRPSAFPQRRSLTLLQGAYGLPSAALQSPPASRTIPQTASGATLHSLRSFRALGHWETRCRRAQSRRTGSCRQRDSQQPRLIWRRTPGRQC